ncbi:MAG: type IX secretion system membrane protein PorP/SprF [Bacteroidetes bacterium]|nr:type IX secretion system membrane protein PorP/SprF [Bacteroidota bacterium]
MSTKNFFLAIALFVIAGGLYKGYAQDPSFSQSYLSKVYLNPATSGSEQGMSLFLNYRNQWNNIPGGFNTASVALDIQSPRFSSGFGVHAFYDQAGGAALRTNMAGLTYAYIVRVNENFNIHLGVGASYVHKSLDLSKLVFSDQIDPFEGIGQGGTEATVVNDKVNFVDIDAGALFRFKFKVARRDIHNSVGFAVHHLTTPIESFQEQDSRIPRRYTVHFGSMIPVSKNYTRARNVFYISPVIKYEVQAGVDIFTAGFFNTFKPVFVGVLYQDNGFGDSGGTRTMIFTGGISADMTRSSNITIGYSYDMNFSGVTNLSGGVHEIAMKFNFEKVQLFNKSKSSKNPQKCYQFKGNGSIRLF